MRFEVRFVFILFGFDGRLLFEAPLVLRKPVVMNKSLTKQPCLHVANTWHEGCVKLDTQEARVAIVDLGKSKYSDLTK